MADVKCFCLSLCFNVSESKHVMKKLTTYVTVALKVFIDKAVRNILLFPYIFSFQSFRSF